MQLSSTLTVLLIIGGALLTLAVAWGAVLTRQKSMGKEIDDLKDKREVLKKEYLTEKDHDLLCLNNTLRFEAHVTRVVEAMGDTLVGKIENIINGDQ